VLYESTFALPYTVFFDGMPAEHLNFLELLVPYYRNADAVFVHAGIDETIPLDQQRAEVLMFGGTKVDFPIGIKATTSSSMDTETIRTSMAEAGRIRATSV
jgi:hypothetical protein